MTALGTDVSAAPSSPLDVDQAAEWLRPADTYKPNRSMYNEHMIQGLKVFGS